MPVRAVLEPNRSSGAHSQGCRSNPLVEEWGDVAVAATAETQPVEDSLEQTQISISHEPHGQSQPIFQTGGTRARWAADMASKFKKKRRAAATEDELEMAEEESEEEASGEIQSLMQMVKDAAASAAAATAGAHIAAEAANKATPNARELAIEAGKIAAAEIA